MGFVEFGRIVGLLGRVVGLLGRVVVTHGYGVVEFVLSGYEGVVELNVAQFTDSSSPYGQST
jgi:hypothetical protein